MAIPKPSGNLRPFLILAILFAIAYLLNRPERHGDAPNREPGIELIRRAFPGAATLAEADPDGTRPVLDESGRAIGRVAVSPADADRYVGYGGPTPVVIALDLEGLIRSVLLLPNHESESFVEYIEEEGLLKDWEGLPPRLAIGRRVDGISGATFTSTAVVHTVRHTLKPLTENAETAANGTMPLKRFAPLPVLLLALILFVFPKRLKPLRPVYAVVNIAVLGVFTGAMLSLAQVEGWVINGLPVRTMPVLTGIALLAVLVPLFTGKAFYCTCVCPFGAVQDLAGMLRRKKLRAPTLLRKALPGARATALILTFVATVLQFSWDPTPLEPFAVFQYRSAQTGVLILAGIFVLAAPFFGRLWCRTACPTGYLLEICRRAGSKHNTQHNPGGDRMTKFERTVMVLLIAVLGLIALKPEIATIAERIPKPRSDRDILEVIHGRKSVRHYTGEAVSDEQVDTLLRAAMAAPTAGNAQPWAFVVIRDREKLAKLAEGLEYGRMLSGAGVAIIVCGVPEEAATGPENDLWLADCSCASQNMLLAAEGTGLGAVWVGVYPLPDRMDLCRSVASLPDDIIPLNIISVGHPAGVEKPKMKFKEEKIHREEW